MKSDLYIFYIVLLFKSILIETIEKYWPHLSELQYAQIEQLENLYKHWNAQINVISRKDIEKLYLKHVLHSTAVAKFIWFKDGTHILDVGTGGGFPGIPLAILFPEVQFLLVDSIAKKLKVVEEVANTIGLKNIEVEHNRAEKIRREFDFVVSRAVTAMPSFVNWVKDKLHQDSRNTLENGILYLKGGDLTEELSMFKHFTIFNLKDEFDEPFFETKKLVHLPYPFIKRAK